ncbi:ABC transporter permease [Cryptosporangium phraense]|uniref:ABC transporter permease n=1 Tax=Cryptosporangium phraense TaxID=2593070 RepID=A0A545AVQ9_9ACTN|nr:ABC transporter permease [Cryptosporangium phraense]TQS45427.1 ABC transporter permease [Cryptosporangium phraense]
MTRWLLVPPLGLLAIGLIGPLIAVVAAGVAADGPVGMVTGPFSSATFLAAAGRTIWLSALVTLGTVVLGVAYAAALVAAPRRLAAALFGVLFLTFWVSLLVRTFGWVLTLQPAGALDVLAGHQLDLYQTTPGLVPAMIHILLPYLVLPVYADLRGLDAAQLRAARSLGGGEWLTIRSVVLPAIRPGLVAGAVIVFVLSLGFYVTPAFLGGPGGQVVAIVIGTQFGRLTDLGGAAAMGVLLLVATLGLYLLADRFLGIGRSWDAAVGRD